MRPAPLVWLALVPLCTAALHAQRPAIGVLVGHSFVAGRTLVDASAGLTVVEGPARLTGGDQAGLDARAFADLAIAATPLSIRLDAFFNRLTTGPQTFGFVDGQFAPTARAIAPSDSPAAWWRRPPAPRPSHPTSASGPDFSSRT